MKESRVSILTQVKSNKKVISLVIVVVIALLVMLFSSYRLLSDQSESSKQSESELILSLQGLFTVLPSLVVAFNDDAAATQGRIVRVRQEITDGWSQLKSFPTLAAENIETVDLAVDESFKYLDLLTSGSDVNELNIAKLTVPVFRLQSVQNNLLNSVDKGALKTNTQIQIIVIAVAVISLSLILMAFILWRDASATQKLSDDEDLMHQSAILRLLDELAGLADGDLTVTTTVSEDFTGAIADSVNYTIDQLRQLVSRINTTAVQVSGAAQDSQQTALQLAEASDHQAQEIAGASAAINEMAVTIDQVSANAAESALVASKSVSIAHNGSEMVQNTIHGMDTIREQIQDTSKRIKRLGESTQEIGDIVSLINDIADQTNILALNAAIQASMAGDAGRGFAVVADEVQRLAERSAGATKQIGSLVKTIQTDTNEAVKSMEQTTTEVVSGARLAQDAGVALEEIEGVSANLAELIQNISNAARQQASSAGHISNTMNVIQEITSQTSAGTGATAHAIGDLADMALELREFVAGFKLPDDMNTAIPFNEEKAARDQAAQPPVMSNKSSALSAGAASLAPLPLAATSISHESQTDSAENDFTHLFEDSHLEQEGFSSDSVDVDDFDNDSFASEVFTNDAATDFSDMNLGNNHQVLVDEPPTLELSDELSLSDDHFDVSDDVIDLVDNDDNDGLEEEFDLDDLDIIDSKSTEKI
jgi:methyl-accepting chemotaxis protein